MDQLELRKRRERVTLPLGYHSLNKLMDPSSVLRQQVDAQWPAIIDKYGVANIHDLAQLQGVAYRNLSSEHFADTFASDVFDANPQLLERFAA